MLGLGHHGGGHVRHGAHCVCFVRFGAVVAGEVSVDRLLEAVVFLREIVATANVDVVRFLNVRSRVDRCLLFGLA